MERPKQRFTSIKRLVATAALVSFAVGAACAAALDAGKYAEGREDLHVGDKYNTWYDTEIAFEFLAENDQTLVRFDHLGWPEVMERFRDCSRSWAYFLESLRSLLEEGRGTPEALAPACDSPSGG